MKPGPEPIWQRWVKDPKKAERLYMAYVVAMILVNLALILGFVIFVVLLVKR